MAALVADTLIFTFLGISTVLHLAEGDEIWDPALICFTLIFILIFRFVFFGVFYYFYNFFSIIFNMLCNLK